MTTELAQTNLMQENLFQEYFEANEWNFDMLAMSVKARDQFPVYQTATTGVLIAVLVKAEYSTMAMYYRKAAIPNAEAVVKQLREEYEASGAAQVYPMFDKTNLFDSTFRNVLQESIMAGYIGISHKIEYLVGFISSHSKGEAYGVMDKPTYRTVDFVAVLKKDFDFDFNKLSENEPMTNPDHIKNVITPRIHRIRTTANRIKHQGGYPKRLETISTSKIYDMTQDFIIPYFPAFEDYPTEAHRNRIPFSASEFLLDLDYAGRYIDIILIMIQSLNEYSIALEINKLPVKAGNESARDEVVNVLIPRHRNVIQRMVDCIKGCEIDLHYPIDQHLPHPSSFFKPKGQDSQ